MGVEVSKNHLEFTWHSEDQQEIFYHPAKFKVVRAGRRYGKTEGGATRCLEESLTIPKLQTLWVDVTQLNISRYVNEVFLPGLPQDIYHWSEQKKILKFPRYKSQIVFASAERPQNMEGFAYDRVYLNEAGIILKERPKMWSQSIRPMMLENPNCKACFIGTPKVGAYQYQTFSERCRDDKFSDWVEFHRSSYDNPLLGKEQIDELISETPDELVQQEIFAEWVTEGAGYVVIPPGLVVAAMKCDAPLTPGYRTKWGVDVAGAGADRSALAKRCRNHLLEPVKTFSRLDERQFAATIRDIYDDTEEKMRPSHIYVDANGIGKTVYSYLDDWGLPARAVMVQNVPSNDRYYQLRDELWFRARQWFEEGGVVMPHDMDFMKELTTPLYDPAHGKGKTKVESKKELRKRGSSSPDMADAFCLTFTGGRDRVDPALMSRFARKQKSPAGGSWMSY